MTTQITATSERANMETFLLAEGETIRIMLHRTIQDIVSIGEHLEHVYAVTPKTQDFYAWASEALGLSRSSVNNFMNVALFVHDNKVPIAHSLEPTALYLLAAPTTPTELIDAVSDGSIAPDVQSIKSALRDYRQDVPQHAHNAHASTVATVLGKLIENLRMSEIHAHTLTSEERESMHTAMKNVLAGVKDSFFAPNNRAKTLTTLREFVQALHEELQ